jgi:hypothetical protein
VTQASGGKPHRASSSSDGFELHLATQTLAPEEELAALDKSEQKAKKAGVKFNASQM